jgi:hypothetical protein
VIRIKHITVLNQFSVRLELTNGKKRNVDLEPFLHGPIFDEIKRNPSLFRSMKVDKQLGTIVWDNGADIDPDVLLGIAEPEWKSIPVKRQHLHAKQQTALVREPTTTYRARKKKK